MKVILLRHAESIFNKYRFDIVDCGLTWQGIQQAGALRGYYDLVICSPLKRAQETLFYSHITYGRLEIQPLCREFRRDLCDLIIGEDLTYREPLDVLLERVQACKEYLHTLSTQRILLVSHGDFIFYLTSRFKGDKRKRVGTYLGNTQMVEYEF